jgi:GDP-4-dehydro-6-deoxy-D-mannose reductase
LLFKKGKKGEVYNICSGEGTTLKELIDKMADILKVDVTTSVNENLIRPSDNRIIIGSNKKIRQDTGWQKEISLEKSLEDIISYWQGA